MHFIIQAHQPRLFSVLEFHPSCWFKLHFHDPPFLNMVLPNPNTKLHSGKHWEVECRDAGDLHVTHSWGSWLLGLCGGGGEGAVALRSETALLLKLDNTQLQIYNVFCDLAIHCHCNLTDNQINQPKNIKYIVMSLSNFKYPSLL